MISTYIDREPRPCRIGDPSKMQCDLWMSFWQEALHLQRLFAPLSGWFPCHHPSFQSDSCLKCARKREEEVENFSLVFHWFEFIRSTKPVQWKHRKNGRSGRIFSFSGVARKKESLWASRWLESLAIRIWLLQIHHHRAVFRSNVASNDSNTTWEKKNEDYLFNNVCKSVICTCNNTSFCRCDGFEQIRIIIAVGCWKE